MEEAEPDGNMEEAVPGNNVEEAVPGDNAFGVGIVGDGEEHNRGDEIGV